MMLGKLSPGDEFIVVDPGFDSFPNIIRSYGGNVIYTQRKDNFEIDLEDIENKCTSRTKSIVLCIPDNPFGIIGKSEDIASIVQLCKEKDITLVVDYSFAEISPFGIQVPLLVDLNPEDLSYIMIGDTGKILGLQGSKFGALIYSQNLGEKIENKVNNYFFQLNQYDLFLVSSILSDEKYDDYIVQLNNKIAKNYDYLKEHLSPEVTLANFEGSSVCLLNVESTGMKDTEFVEKLGELGVGLVPVSYFYSGLTDVNNNLVRLALARPEEDIKKAVEIINNLFR